MIKIYNNFKLDLDLQPTIFFPVHFFQFFITAASVNPISSFIYLPNFTYNVMDNFNVYSA